MVSLLDSKKREEMEELAKLKAKVKAKLDVLYMAAHHIDESWVGKEYLLGVWKELDKLHAQFNAMSKKAVKEYVERTGEKTN